MASIARTRCTPGACAALLVLLLASCTWEPTVRPIEPQQLKTGAFFVVQHEPIDGADYVTVIEGLPREVDKLSLPALRRALDGSPRSILDVDRGELCKVPGTPQGVLRRFDDPDRDVLPSHWRMVVRRERADGPHLELVDQHCKKRGPSLPTVKVPTTFTDAETGAPHLMVLTEDAELWWLDPWENDKRRIAQGVQAWSFVAGRPNDKLDPDERGLLLKQDDQLVVRTFNGEEIARFGSDVDRYTQTNAGGLRVAYESRGAIYEVVAGDLDPVRIAGGEHEACSPSYSGATLTYFSPCDEQQYNRLNLSTGQVENFAPGVFLEYSDRGWSFELRQSRETGSGASSTQRWVTPPGKTQAVRLEEPLSHLRPIDRTRLAARDADHNFGIWTVDEGFVKVLEGVEWVETFIDTRATPDRDEPVFLWMVHHDVHDGVGRLSLLSAKTLELEPVVSGVPIGGFTTETFAALLDPALVLLKDATLSGATLEARLIPDLIGATIDDGVISFTPKADPQQPGLYYSIGPGEREGIWFAPL